MKTIKEVRKNLDITQKQMAELLGMTQHRVSEIERGVNGRSETHIQVKLLKAIEFIAHKGLFEEFKKGGIT